MFMKLWWFTLALTAATSPVGAATAVVKTSHGSFTIQLLGDQAPRSVSHFIELVETGFYRGLTIHRVLPGLLIQGGDPKGDGSGGPGYCVDDEFHKDLRHKAPGVVSFAGEGPNSIGSQFTITLDKVGRLDNRNSVFGQIVEGLEVARAIGASKLQGSNPKPPVIIEDIVIRGKVSKIPIRKRKELDEKSAVEVVGPAVDKLLSAIASAQDLGAKTKVILKSVKSRCSEAQIYYQVSFQRFKKASLLIYGDWRDAGFAIQQFQFSRGPG